MTPGDALPSKVAEEQGVADTHFVAVKLSKLLIEAGRGDALVEGQGLAVPPTTVCVATEGDGRGVSVEEREETSVLLKEGETLGKAPEGDGDALDNRLDDASGDAEETADDDKTGEKLKDALTLADSEPVPQGETSAEEENSPELDAAGDPLLKLEGLAKEVSDDEGDADNEEHKEEVEDGQGDVEDDDRALEVPVTLSHVECDGGTETESRPEADPAPVADALELTEAHGNVVRVPTLEELGVALCPDERVGEGEDTLLTLTLTDPEDDTLELPVADSVSDGHAVAVPQALSEG